MPLDFSLPFLKADVGGDRGFEAAPAFRRLAAAVSCFEGDNRKTKMNIHKTTPITIVIGLCRRNDRTGPMAPFGVLNCQFCTVRVACAKQPRLVSRMAIEDMADWTVFPSVGELRDLSRRFRDDVGGIFEDGGYSKG